MSTSCSIFQQPHLIKSILLICLPLHKRPNPKVFLFCNGVDLNSRKGEAPLDHDFPISFHHPSLLYLQSHLLKDSYGDYIAERISYNPQERSGLILFRIKPGTPLGYSCSYRENLIFKSFLKPSHC